MVKVEFHFDFGSPNAYLSHLVIPEIEKHTGANFDYVPVLLGGVFKMTNNRSPAESLRGIRNKPEYERLETQRFMRRHGITRFQSNPFFPVSTLAMMRGAIALARWACSSAMLTRCTGTCGPSPRKWTTRQFFRNALTEAGLDADRIFQLIETREIKNELIKNTERSVERGTFGSPTFYVGDEIFFGKDRLREVEELIAQSK
jgi:2-hydroxychromene-2-carboxylate isomerase